MAPMAEVATSLYYDLSMAGLLPTLKLMALLTSK